jgi:hypothetical protein
MKPDCIFFDGCSFPTRLCDDDCYSYEKEGRHPFEDDDNQADYLRDMEIEMGVEE